jgi:hypothetical protein
MPGAFVIARDARGSLVHVRRRDDGECVGCIEVGLYEIVRALVLEEAKRDGSDGHREGDTSSAPSPPCPDGTVRALRAASET